MSLAIRTNPHEDVGDILVKVQEDLNRLRTQVLDGKHSEVDLATLQQAIANTEDSIKAKSEQWVQHVNHQVLMIPDVGTPETKQQKQHAAAETTWDLQANTRGTVQLRRTGRETYGLLEHSALGQKKRADSVPNVSKNLRQERRMYPAYAQPSVGDDRLPTIKDKSVQKKVVIPYRKDSTTSLPKVLDDEDDDVITAPISESEARQGLLRLMERGVVPPSADISFQPNPVQNTPAAMHDPDIKQQRNVHIVDPTAGLKLDPVVPVKRRAPRSAKKRHSAHGRRDSAQRDDPTRTQTQPLPPPTTPASSDSHNTNYRFAVHNGKVRDTASDFVAFQRQYQTSWADIDNFLQHLENMCTDFAVPIAFVNGDKLAQIAGLVFEEETTPTVEELLSVVINREDVEQLIHRPGRRLLGPDGGEVAAVRIQATYRGFRERRRYLSYKEKLWAVGVIARVLRANVKLSKLRRQVKGKQTRLLEAYRQRQLALAGSWSRVRCSRRLIIHVPSLGFPCGVRKTMSSFNVRQNAQMTRLCDLMDSDVDIVYISPVPIEEDTKQYCAKLLGLRAAINAADAKVTADLSNRYTLIVPEAAAIFKSHNMCLSTVLKYSPQALNRLSNLVKGRDAYILPGIVHTDDLYISDYLGVPVLGPEPETALTYSSKSAAKRIFASAEVDTPPSAHDVYSLQQLHEGLAALVTENILVAKWLFKLDHESDGRGTAVCDVARNLSCYSWAMKEARRYGDKWNKPWARESAYYKIYAEIPKIVAECSTPISKERFSTWDKFLEAFLREGGVVEAYPPSANVTNLTADLLIEPDGRGSVIATGDQLHAENPLRCWGHSVPQSSVEPEEFELVCDRILDACRKRQIIGHVSVDFATFIHPEMEKQQLWAIDLQLAHSDLLSMTKLMDYVTSGSLDAETQVYNIPALQIKPSKKKGAKAKKVKAPKNEPEQRFAVLSTRLLHNDLAILHYSTFFQMCRAHGIGYDVKERIGSIFSLNDCTQREHIGMMTIFGSLEAALENFVRNLNVVNQEVSVDTDVKTNFKSAIKDLEAILGTTEVNAEEEKTDDPGSTQLAITNGH